MRNPMYAVAVIAVVAIAGLGAFYAFGPGRDVGSQPISSPNEQPTQAPSQTPAASAPPLDTSSWTSYESERYGWTIARPADWTVIPAQHNWRLGRDAADVMSSGQEMFMAPDEGIRVSAWSVAVNEEETPQTRAGIEAWIDRYCQEASGASCSADLDRAVPLCVEKWDCHPGLLVPFQYEVQAFFTGGLYSGEMVVVTVWWGEDEPAVVPYGGSQRLLEAFISTMAVWPESVPLGERECFTVPSYCGGS